MTERIKVLWIIKGLSAGGAEKLLAMSLPYIDREKFDYRIVYFLKRYSDLVSTFEQSGIPVYCLNMGKIYDIRAFFRLLKLIRKLEIDILHIHSPFAAIIGRIAGFICRVNKIITTEHEIHRRLHPVTKFGTLFTYPLNHTTIAVSKAVADSLTKHSMVPSSRIHIVHNAIDLGTMQSVHNHVDVRKSLGIKPNDMVVGNVAHIRPGKGHTYFLEAAHLILKQRTDVTFVITGKERTEKELNELLELAKELRIRDKILFTGFRSDAIQVMSAFDVFVLPSISEAFGIVLLEAMNLEIPIVASRVGGIPEVVVDGRNGFLVSPRNPQELADKILKLLNNENIRIRMGKEGKKMVRESFDIANMVKRVEQIYLSILV